MFFLCDPDGDVPIGDGHGLGLYYHDCRYLDGYEVRLADARADRLASDTAAGSWATFQLSNPDLKIGDRLVQKESLAIKWERTVDADACALRDTFAFTNFSVEPVDVPVVIRLHSRFDSLFAVRGASQEKRGVLHEPQWQGPALILSYDGADSVRRTLHARFDPEPSDTDGTQASIDLHIAPHETVTVSVSLQIRESKTTDRPTPHRSGPSNVTHVRRAVQQSSDEWMAAATQVECDSPRLTRVLHRSLRDLHTLRTKLQGREYFAAGVPWYVTLFGRDSILTAIEALAFMPDRAEDTLRLLACYQGDHEDPWRDEAAGKVMHELRVGEMANLKEIPQTPYYGSVDATPLFLILMASHAAWTGRVDVFTDLESHVKAALRWINDSLAEGDGYLRYASESRRGLANQGWKDSGDSIVNRDGSLAQPPIALVEVQGYVYMAKRGMAGLYRRVGDTDTADRLEREAEDLQRRFEHDFWLEDIGTYALALQQDNRPAAVVSSNPGQALWTGIVSQERANNTAACLMHEDMFSGWGIRTLSTRERRYNPLGYHDGTVWPHDNAIAVAGFRRYGCLDNAVRVMSGIVAAASHFDHDRLPEVFAGFSRQQFAVPVHYPVACHPQAWAAGAVPFMIESTLGLQPDGFEGRLRVTSPILPDDVTTLTIDRLRVGNARATIRFSRDGNRRVVVDDVRVDGTLEVSCDE